MAEFTYLGLAQITDRNEFFACGECGACVVDKSGDGTNRIRHSEWHTELAKKLAKGSAAYSMQARLA